MSKQETVKDLVYYLSLPYTITLKPDDEGDYIARVHELSGCVAHGGDQKEALDNLRTVQEAWIQECLESGKSIPEPEPEQDGLPSGKWLQRVPRSLHRRLTQMATNEGVSLNALVTSMLSDAVSARSVHNQFRDYFKVWIDEVGLPAASHGIVPIDQLDRWDASLGFAGHWGGHWTLSGRQHHYGDLLLGLNAAQKLIAASDESTDAYDPKKEIPRYSRKETTATARR